MYKMVISRVTAEGETVQVEVSAKTGPELQDKLAYAAQSIDKRLYEQNMRIIAGHTVIQKLEPTVRELVHDVYRLLTGQRFPKPGELVTQILSSDTTQQEMELKAQLAEKSA